MSTVQISIVTSNGVSATGAAAPVTSSAMVGAAEIIASSGSSQPLQTLDATDLDSTRLDQYFWRIAVVGTESVYAAFGAAPTASSTSGFLCPAGGVYEFRINAGTDIVAVINA
jgi:hypothetical protein